MRFESTLRLAACAAVAAAAALAVAGGCSRDPEAPPARPAPPPPRPARPLVALVRHAPWGGADDRPLFVLYDDGRALVPRTVDGVVSYRAAHVDLRDRDAALARLGIGPAFFALPPVHALAAPPDAPGEWEALVLAVWRGDTVTTVAVGVPPLGHARLALPEATPAPFRDAYRALTTFRAADAAEWRPAHVEVVARPYEYAPDGPPLPWPAGWPGLASPGAARRVAHAVDTTWTIPLPYDRLGDLRRLLRRRRTRQAIQIGDRRVAVSWRLAFPGEARWRAELARLEAMP